jgi:hypothetical protein
LREERWLRACAERNGLKPWFFDEEVKRHHRGRDSATPLGIEGVTIRP